MKFFREHKTLKLLAVYIVFVTMHLAWRFLIGAQGHAYLGSNQNYFWGEVIGKGIPALIVAALAGTMGCLKWNGKNMLRSLFSGMLILILMGLFLWVRLYQIFHSQTALKGVGDIVWFLLFVWMIGFTEELFFRGVILESFLRIFGNTRSGIWKAVLLGALMFGAMHFTTMLRGHSIQATLFQVFSTTVLGSVFCSIYVRHRSLYGCAFLHAFNNLASLLEYGICQGRSMDETYLTDSAGNPGLALLMLTPFVIATLVILRKKKLTEIIERVKTSEGTCVQVSTLS